MLDVDREEMWNITLSAAATRLTDWEEGYDYTPKTLKYTLRHSISFGLNWHPGRYADEWAVIFTPSE